MRKVVQPGDVAVLDEKNSHIRNRDGTVIKLDVNSGVYTMDMWVCLDNSCASPRKVIEVKDHWANISSAMDSGAAGYVMPPGMFPRVKLVGSHERNKEIRCGKRRMDQGLG